MYRKYFLYLIVSFIIVINIACNTKTENNDEESWNNAFKKQEVLDVKPEKAAELSLVCKSPRLAYIDQQYLYIYDAKDKIVYIYSREDYRLKVKFGGKGEGPGEFRQIHGLKTYKDFICVNSPGKISYFSKKGILLKEVRCPPHLIPCVPIGDNFVTDEYSMPPPGGHRNPNTERTIVLVGPDFNKKKILFQKTLNIAVVYNPVTGRNTFTLFPDACFFKVYKNNIYIGYASLEGFFFNVFNPNGKKLYEINRPYRKRKVSNILKKAILKKPYRLSWGNNQVLQIKFYKYFPAFSNFEVADDKIYIFLYPEIDRQRILVLDLKGKLIDVSLIPFNLKSLENNSYQIFYYSKHIYKGERYYLKANDETNKLELWRLKLIDINSSTREIN
jgi:hypothetical protein